MSQIFYLGFSFYSIWKNGKVLMYFFNFFPPRFHKTKTRMFKKHLRYSSLHSDLNSMSVKFEWIKKKN